MLLPRTRRTRRGVNALETGLVMPLLVVLMTGLIDYGWFFWQESLVTNAMRAGVRTGSLKRPADSADQDCPQCLNTAEGSSENKLLAEGFTIDMDGTASLLRIPATGVPCIYTVVVEKEIPYTPLVGILPSPDHYTVRVQAIAQNVVCE